MAGPDRKQMVEDILTLIKAASTTELALLKDKSIQFGLRTFHQFYASQYREGVFVAPQSGPVEALTLSAAKQDFNQTLEFQIFIMGHDPVGDTKRAITVSEEIEELLYDQTNIRLPNGGECLGFTEWEMGPPVSTRDANLTLHFVLMEVLYRKTLTL